MGFLTRFDRIALAVALTWISGYALARPDAELSQKILDAARRSALDPRLVEAVVRVESNFSSTARSSKGAMGLMQLIPRTADEMAVPHPFHPTSNLMGACDYLRRLLNRYRGNLTLALAAYNAGPSNVDRHGGVPPFPETREYVEKVMRLYAGLRASRRPVP